MTAKVWARSLVGALALLLGASCARTELYGYPDSDGGEHGVGGASAASGTGFDSGGGTSGASSAGTSSSGGRFGGMPGRGGTSGTTSGGTSSRGGSSGSAGSGPVVSGGVCPTLGGRGDQTVILSLLSREELWLVQANGSFLRVNANAAGDAQIWKEGNFLVLAQRGENGLTLSLVDRAGNVLWSYSELTEPIDAEQVWVNEGGDAAIWLTGDAFPGVAVLSSGQAFRLPNAPLGPPDALGWVPVAGLDWRGFANVHNGQVRRASRPVASPRLPILVWHGMLVYLSQGARDLSVSLFSPDAEWNFELPGLHLESARLALTDLGAVVSEHAFPFALLDATVPALWNVGPFVRDPVFEYDTLFHTHGIFGLVVEGQVPRDLLDLRSRFTTRVAPAPYAPRHAVTNVLMNDLWALGATFEGSPLFRVSRATATVDRIDLSRLAPLEPFESCWPESPVLLDDGQIALALRNGTVAAIHTGNPTAGPWVRLGHFVSNIERLEVSKRSGAWIVAADSKERSFCPTSVSGPVDPSAGQVFLGNSVQILMPESEVDFEDHHVSEFVFHESGLCAVVRGFVHDFPSGVRTELPPDASQVTFW